MVSRKRNTITCEEFELLMLSLLGFELSAHAVDGCLKEIGSLLNSKNVQSIPFDVFLKWYISTPSAHLNSVNSRRK